MTLRKNKFREARIELEQDLPNAFIVNKAEKAEKKSYPVRWLIVLTSLIATFILSLLLFAILESVKKK